ncbi:MAG: cadmium-translocating P-type ATPase [Alphaproteobacteria bacterium]|nr:MAG: cadmium-translocating P-type ATPase [Alphaproteobacteria bacterium]
MKTDTPQSDLHHIRLKVDGMSCANCAKSVEKALRAVRDVDMAQVNFALEKADVRITGTSTTEADLIQAIETAGYGGRNWQEAQKDDQPSGRRIGEGSVLGLSILLSLPLVLPMLPIGVPMLPPLLQLALATPVQFLIGGRFYFGAWRSLRSGSANMDVLVALGTSAAYFYSLYLINVPEAHLYFEAAAVIITLVLTGKWLESRAKKSAAEALRLLSKLRPEIAHLKRGNDYIDVDVEGVLEGDVVLIKPGERVPVDGDVLLGTSETDNSHVTGESVPVTVSAGDKVYGGALNGAGALEIAVTAGFDNSLLGRVIQLTEEAQLSRAPILRLVDRVSAIFVPVVLGISALTLAAWLFNGHSFEASLLPAIAVLVIACPCALGLATPTALVAGLGVAARSGVLIRDMEAIERAGGLTTVVFDKTGTLTVGHPEVTHIEGDDPQEVLRLAAAVQMQSEHIIGRALLRAARAQNIDLPIALNFDYVVGEGVTAEVSGAKVAIGNSALMARSGIALEGRIEIEGQGTEIFVGRDQSLVGTVYLSDPLRLEAADAVAALRKRGLQTVLLSGDRIDIVSKVAGELGVDQAEGGFKPDEKLRWIEKAQTSGDHIAMIGDGINDAPALAKADLGIAMGEGTDIAMATADITLLRNDLRLIARSLDIARATHRKIWQNLGWAFIYNIIGIPLAALGLLAPTFAAAAMALSSISVVSNSLLLARSKPEGE